VPHSSQRARDRELLPRSICAVTYIPLSSGARLGSWIRYTSGTLVVRVSPISHSPNLGVELVTPLCYKCYLSNGGLGGFAWRARRQGAGKMGWLSSWATNRKQQIRFRGCIAVGVGRKGGVGYKSNGDDKMELNRKKCVGLFVPRNVPS
jgi:hypothetical protein